MLRVWNLSLLFATFCLTILGTFLTRSGVLDSVHAFTQSTIGPALLGVLRPRRRGRRLGLIAWRGDRLRSPGRIDSPVSREGAFLANNLLFAALRVRRAARHRVPAARRGGPEPADLGRRALLRPDDVPIGLAPAVPDGVAPGAAVARRERRAAAAPACCGRRGSAGCTLVFLTRTGSRRRRVRPRRFVFAIVIVPGRRRGGARRRKADQRLPVRGRHGARQPAALRRVHRPPWGHRASRARRHGRATDRREVAARGRAVRDRRREQVKCFGRRPVKPAEEDDPGARPREQGGRRSDVYWPAIS